MVSPVFRRVIGLTFFLPFAYFAVTGALSRKTAMQCAVLFVLGGLQGVLGWYMVASGLVDRVDVSQYRLAAHLSLATFIYGAILWVAFGLGHSRPVPHTARQWCAFLITALVLLQIAAGGFVAGLDAGFGYNTWPQMDGALVPNGLFAAMPWWRNIFENALTVQFNHRMLAYAIAVLAAAQAYLVQTPASRMLFAAVLLQIVLGIWDASDGRATVAWSCPSGRRSAGFRRRHLEPAPVFDRCGGAVRFSRHPVTGEAKVAAYAMSSAVSQYSRDRLIEIGDDVLHILEAD